MSDDDFEDDADLDEENVDEEAPDEDALENGFDVDDEGDDDVIADDELEEADELIEGVPVVATVAADGVPGEDEDDDVVDLDEELHPDDVEEALDVVLRERTVAAGLEDEEDEEDEPDDRGEGTTKIVPRRPGEFLCSSCFLVLPRHQLADEKRMLCRDCA